MRHRLPYLPFSAYYLLILACMLFPGRPVHAQHIGIQSQVFLITKFLQHITWPPQNISGKTIIGVYGNTELQEELQNIVKTSRSGRDIIVKKVSTFKEVTGTQLLYISYSRSRELQSIIKELKIDEPVLIVAEREGLAKKGATINFYVKEDNTLGFEYNKSELSRRKLVATPELLAFGDEIKVK